MTWFTSRTGTPDGKGRCAPRNPLKVFQCLWWDLFFLWWRIWVPTSSNKGENEIISFLQGLNTLTIEQMLYSALWRWKCFVLWGSLWGGGEVHLKTRNCRTQEGTRQAMGLGVGREQHHVCKSTQASVKQPVNREKQLWGEMNREGRFVLISIF